jgi:hypothetical protein
MELMSQKIPMWNKELENHMWENMFQTMAAVVILVKFSKLKIVRIHILLDG